MKYKHKTHHRRSIRLSGYDYSQNGAYFITICTQNKKCQFGQIDNGEMKLNTAGASVKEKWLALPDKFQNIELDTFVIMPNHLHGIVVINSPMEYKIVVGVPAKATTGGHESPLRANIYKRRGMLLSKIVGYFKMNSAKQINVIKNTSGQPVWQRNYYEHIIRNEKSLQTIYDYILTNPENWNKDELFTL